MLVFERRQKTEELLARAAPGAFASADAPGRIGIDPRSDPRDLAQTDLPLKRALEVTPPQRGLRGMHALQDEHGGEVVAVGEGEQPRPKVVILALEEGRVVPQVVCRQRLAVNEHRRMEERRAEQRVPAQGQRTLRQQMRSSPVPALVEVGDSRAHDGRMRVGAKPLDLTLEPLGQRDVVRVEAGDVLAARFVEPAVERGGETALPVVAQHGEARVVDLREHGGRLVGRRVVDREQLEVAERLAQHAVDGLAQKARVVVNGEEDGHERHGR